MHGFPESQQNKNYRTDSDLNRICLVASMLSSSPVSSALEIVTKEIREGTVLKFKNDA
jgi:hypothetical protein